MTTEYLHAVREAEDMTWEKDDTPRNNNFASDDTPSSQAQQTEDRGEE